jgi:hypothetical protein
MEPNMKTPLTDAELLDLLLDEHFDKLSEHAAEAFPDFRERGLGRKRPFSPKQREWIRNVAVALELEDAPTENVFSSLPKRRQEEQKKAAAKVLMPWEKPGGEWAPPKKAGA